jgi:integrase
VAIPAVVAGTLAEHLAHYSRPRDPTAVVFLSERGAPVQHANFRNRVFRPAAAAAGLDPLPTVHDLRHTAAALAILRHAGVKQIQEQLGHSSVTAQMAAIATTCRLVGDIVGSAVGRLRRAASRAGADR